MARGQTAYAPRAVTVRTRCNSLVEPEIAFLVSIYAIGLVARRFMCPPFV
jgi:hypothetical protein